MLAFGRTPYPSELNYWLSRGNLSIAQLISFHRQGHIEYSNLHKETIIKSYIDALGRNPSEDEIKYWMNGNSIYIELMSNHMTLLKLNNWENERVIRLAYVTVLQREPGNLELNFWEKQGTTAFFLLAGYLGDYKAKNKNKESIDIANIKNFLSVSAISLSPPIASEAFKFINKRGSAIVARTISQHRGSIIATGKNNILSK